MLCAGFVEHGNIKTQYRTCEIFPVTSNLFAVWGELSYTYITLLQDNDTLESVIEGAQEEGENDILLAEYNSDDEGHLSEE